MPNGKNKKQGSHTMKSTNVTKIELKRVGGYLTTIAAALGSAYFMSCSHIVLGLMAIVVSFSANYYTDFVLTR